MELRQLRVFVAIVEERSFTRAAERLHVVQSAVSASLRTLELELGVTLIDRGASPVVMTHAGQALLAEARRTLAAADAAVAAVDEVRGGVRGRVQLGVMQWRSMGQRSGLSLPRALARFREEHPAVEVLVRHTGGSLEMAEQLRTGKLDLAFVALPAADYEGLALLPLAREPLVLTCHHGHPLAGAGPVRLADLAGETFADVPLTWGIRMAVDAAFAAAGLQRDVTYEVNDVAAIAEFATHDLAVVLLPAFVAEAFPTLRTVEIVDGPAFVTSLATPTGRPLSAAAAALAASIGRQMENGQQPG